MLHELLLALVGCPGDVFLDAREQQQQQQQPSSSCSSSPPADACTFHLAPDLTFLQHSEREILERLLRLGFFYHELDQFSMYCMNLGWMQSPYACTKKDSLDTKDPKTVVSIYTRALANGINEVLSVYRSAVLKVEQDLLSDMTPVLSSVTQHLNKFEILLPPLHALVQEVKSKNLRGGRLLDLLHTKCHCGLPELQMCMQRLLWHGHQVMYRQLAVWMVYGLLQDQHGEFFISRFSDGNKFSGREYFKEKIEDMNGKTDADLADWHSAFHILEVRDLVGLSRGHSVEIVLSHANSHNVH